jgi:hypothetical protein
MATNQNQAATGKQRPVISVRNKGRSAPIKVPDEGKAPKLPHAVTYATDKDLVEGLRDSMGFHKDALNIELAVSLLFYAAHKAPLKVDLAVKKKLREIYMLAGYDCKDDKGDDYKTVVRRIGASAALYKWIGGEEIVRDWVIDFDHTEQVEQATKKVAGYKFDGINSVLAKSGAIKVKGTRDPKIGAATPAAATQAPPPATLSEDANKPRTGEPEGADKDVAEGLDKDIQARRDEEEAARRDRRAGDRPDAHVFRHGKVFCAIPPDVEPQDVMALAQDLMGLATRLLATAGHTNNH